MFLITGFGRSGTHYTAALLQAIGLDAPHEDVGRDGAVSWKHIAPGSYVYLGKNRAREIVDPGFSVVIHQVRDPLKVISSAYTFPENSWHYMEQTLGLTPERGAIWQREDSLRMEYERDWHRKRQKFAGILRTLFSARPARHAEDSRDFHAVLRRAMRCWLGWNKLIEQRAVYRFQIEEIAAHWPELLRLIGHPPVPLPELPHRKRDSRQDRSSYREVSWDDLYAADAELAQSVASMAASYGYAQPPKSSGKPHGQSA